MSMEYSCPSLHVFFFFFAWPILLDCRAITGTALVTFKQAYVHECVCVLLFFKGCLRKLQQLALWIKLTLLFLILLSLVVKRHFFSALSSFERSATQKQVDSLSVINQKFNSSFPLLSSDAPCCGTRYAAAACTQGNVEEGGQCRIGPLRFSPSLLHNTSTTRFLLRRRLTFYAW